MPKFDWNIDPVLVEIPKGPIVGLLAVLGVLVLLNGLRRKAFDLQTIGAVMLGAALLLWKFLGGGFGLRYYSLIFVAVFLGGYSLFNWQVKRGGGTEEDSADFIVYGVLGVLIGARLGHVLFYDLDKALEDPIWVVQIWTGGLASHGAVIGLITAMYLYTRQRRIPFLEGSDRFAFSAALGAALVRLGNFFNSEIVGRVTDQTWGVRFLRVDGPNGMYRHPSQLYEFAMGLGILGALVVFDRALGRERRPRGAMISMFFVLYFCGRFLIEYVKEWQTLTPETSPFTMGQWLSIPGFLLGVIGLVWSFRARLPVGWRPAFAEGEDEDEDEDEDSAPSSDARGRSLKVDPDVLEEFDKDGKLRKRRSSKSDSDEE